MRSDSATLRARLVLPGAVAGAALILLGSFGVGASSGQHPTGRIATLGLPVGVALIAAGLVTLLLCGIASRGSSPRRSAHAATTRSQAAHQHRAAVSEREQVLDPTTVYSPRGLLDIPRDARTPESAGAPEGPWPQGTPGPYAAGPLGPQASPGRAGASPRPPYQPGTNSAGPGWVPPAQGSRQPQPPTPPGEQGRPGYATSPGQAPLPRAADSGQGFGSRPADSGQGFGSRPGDSGQTFASRPADAGQGFGSRPADSGQGFGSRPADSGQGFGSRPADSGQTFASRPADSGQGLGSRPADTGQGFGSRPAETGQGFASRPPDSGQAFPPRPTAAGSANAPRHAGAPGRPTPPPGSASGSREAGPNPFPRPAAQGRETAPPREPQWPGGPQPPRGAGPAGQPGPSGQGPRYGQERQPPGPGTGGWPPPRGPGYAPPGSPGSASRGGAGHAPSGGPSQFPGGPGYAPPGDLGYAPPGGPGYAPGGPGYAPPGGPGYGPGGPGYAPPGGSGYGPGGPGRTPPGGSGYGPGGPGYIPPDGSGYGASGPGYAPPRGFGYVPPGDPGYAPPGGRRPVPPGPPGPQGPPGTFTGGYAPVIRATDHPAPPAGVGRTSRPARPGDSDGPPDSETYVYRDPSARAGYLADQRAQEREAAYWYDLVADPGAAEREETRGPFEPLLPSSGEPSRVAPHEPSAPAAMATPAGLDEGPEEPSHAQERKLEEIKDFYLTAEAIGEENVDKHFDRLLAQQRELISEYFRQSAAARHADGLPTQAAASPIEPRQRGGPPGQPGQFGTQEGAGVAAEPPRSW